MKKIITTLSGYNDDDTRFIVAVFADQRTTRRVEGEQGFLPLLRQAVRCLPHDTILRNWLAELDAQHLPRGTGSCSAFFQRVVGRQGSHGKRRGDASRNKRHLC